MPDVISPLQNSIMLLMDAVESQFISMETWPKAIMAILFAYDPYMLNAISQLETVIFFSTAMVFLSKRPVNSSTRAMDTHSCM